MAADEEMFPFRLNVCPGAGQHAVSPHRCVELRQPLDGQDRSANYWLANQLRPGIRKHVVRNSHCAGDGLAFKLPANRFQYEFLATCCAREAATSPFPWLGLTNYKRLPVQLLPIERLDYGLRFDVLPFSAPRNFDASL